MSFIDGLTTSAPTEVRTGELDQSIGGSKAAFATLTVMGRENGCPPRPTLTVAYLFLVVKIPDPLVWVAIAVWSQVDVLLAAASQPVLFGPFGSNWSSL
jgi:hypothetical protein